MISPRFQLPRTGLDSNHLEYHPEASRGYNATTACVEEEEVPLQANPGGPKSFLDNQRRVREI